MSTVTLDLHLRCEGEPRSLTLHLPTLPLRPAHGRPMDKALLGCELEPLKDASTPLRLQVFHARSGDDSLLVWFQGGCVGAEGPQEAHCAVALEAIPEALQRELGPQAFPGLATSFSPCSALTQLQPALDETGERVVLIKAKEQGFLRYVELITDVPPMTVDCAMSSQDMPPEAWEQLVLLIFFRYIAGLPTPTLSDLVLLQRGDGEPCIVSTAQAGCAAWDSCPLPWHDQMLGAELWERLLQPSGDLWRAEDIPATVRAWPVAEVAVALDPRPSGAEDGAGHTLAEIMVSRQVAVENALLEEE